MKVLNPGTDSDSGIEPVATETPVVKMKVKWKKHKLLLISTLSLLVTAFIADIIWTHSGSNQWELAIDKNGVKVWTLKTPGSALVKIKATTRIHSKLAGMVKLLEDLDSCVDAGCYESKVIETVDTVPGRYAAYFVFRFDIPGPFATREYVALQQHYQNPETKMLEINIIASPNKIAPNPCCVRVTHLHNIWRLTPLANEDMDIEFMQDTDIGGMPYFLANLALTQGTYMIVSGLQDLMNKDKYRTAKINSVQELDAN